MIIFKLAKKLMFFLLILVVLGVAGIWAWRKGYLDKTPLKNIDKAEIEKITQDAGGQTKILTDRAKETGAHVQQVLGEAVQKNDDEPVVNKTVEYAKYLYCKQVVEEYESED